jgi:hypothetical protein
LLGRDNITGCHSLFKNTIRHKIRQNRSEK